MVILSIMISSRENFSLHVNKYVTAMLWQQQECFRQALHIEKVKYWLFLYKYSRYSLTPETEWRMPKNSFSKLKWFSHILVFSVYQHFGVKWSILRICLFLVGSTAISSPFWLWTVSVSGYFRSTGCVHHQYQANHWASNISQGHGWNLSSFARKSFSIYTYIPSCVPSYVAKLFNVFHVVI